jgi:hypothetical protein
MHSPTVNGIQMHKITMDSHAKTNLQGLLVEFERVGGYDLNRLSHRNLRTIVTC